MWQIKYIKDKDNLKSGCGRKIANVIERQNDQIFVIGLPVHERLQGWSYETKKDRHRHSLFYHEELRTLCLGSMGRTVC